MIVIIWFIVVCFAVMPLLGWNQYVYIDDRKHCMILWQMGGVHSAYGVFLSVSSFVIPTWIMVFCYYKIFSTARNQAKKFQKTNIAGSSQNERQASFSNSKVSPLVFGTMWLANPLSFDELESVSTAGPSAVSNTGLSCSVDDETSSKKQVTAHVTREKAERRTARVILIVIGVFQVLIIIAVKKSFYVSAIVRKVLDRQL